MKKIVQCLLITMMTCFLCSCSKGDGNLNIELSPKDRSLFDIASDIYDESELSEIVKFYGSINELNEKFPIECLREDQGVLRVSYRGEDNIAVILFDTSGNYVLGRIHRVERESADFDGVGLGESLQKIREIDPSGEYLFLFTGRNDTPKVSSHYTKDGYFITLEYDTSNKIISIKKQLI